MTALFLAFGFGVAAAVLQLYTKNKELPSRKTFPTVSFFYVVSLSLFSYFYWFSGGWAFWLMFAGLVFSVLLFFIELLFFLGNR